MEFKLPDIGEGTAEGEIIKWLVAVGDVVQEDTPLVEVMTDKATVEIPSPGAGTVVELKAGEGEVVAVGSVIMVLGDGAAVPAVATKTAAAEDVAPAAPPTPSANPSVEAARAVARAELEEDAEREAWEAPAPGPGRVLATPAVRRLAREEGIDLHGVRGSGKGGRVMKQDLAGLAAAKAAPAGTATAEPAVVAPAAADLPAVPVRTEPPAGAPARRPSTSSDEPEERVPFMGLRRRIAARLVAAKQTIPHFTYVEECDATEVVALREQAKQMGAAHGIKVTYLPFFVKALVEAAKRHPILNSSLDEEAGELVYKHYYNVGIATDTERGLVVPVIRNADQLDIFELAREIDRLATDARAGRSAMEDLTGGTITITSTGNIGGVLATPIINSPEVAILGVTAIRPRPVVRDGEIVIREMVNLALSLDHRIVDGAPGAVFMRDMVALLEDPKLQILGRP